MKMIEGWVVIREDSVLVACDSRETALAIAARQGTPSRIEPLRIIVEFLP